MINYYSNRTDQSALLTKIVDYKMHFVWKFNYNKYRIFAKVFAKLAYFESILLNHICLDWVRML